MTRGKIFASTSLKQPAKIKIEIMNNAIKIAIIHVCGRSDVQEKEKQDHIIDSLKSVPGAIKIDIIVGGISILYESLLDDQLLRENVINKLFAKEWSLLSLILIGWWCS